MKIMIMITRRVSRRARKAIMMARMMQRIKISKTKRVTLLKMLERSNFGKR